MVFIAVLTWVAGGLLVAELASRPRPSDIDNPFSPWHKARRAALWYFCTTVAALVGYVVWLGRH